MWSVSAFITEASLLSALCNSSTQKVDLLALMETPCVISVLQTDRPAFIVDKNVSALPVFPSALSAGVNERPAKAVFSNWWWIHLSPTRVLSPHPNLKACSASKPLGTSLSPSRMCSCRPPRSLFWWRASRIYKRQHYKTIGTKSES